MNPFLESFFLEGPNVKLLALKEDHALDLDTAASENRANYGLTSVPVGHDATIQYIQSALQQRANKKALPFAIYAKNLNKIVGSTRFSDIEYWSWPNPHLALQRGTSAPDAAEIGWTWLAASVQRTILNTEMKFLMLSFAFDVWHLHRVTFRTDARNEVSRRAIERIGGKLDGVLRADMPGYDGLIRNTAYYSILRNEWEHGVKAALEKKLNR